MCRGEQDGVGRTSSGNRGGAAPPRPPVTEEERGTAAEGDARSRSERAENQLRERGLTDRGTADTGRSRGPIPVPITGWGTGADGNSSGRQGVPPCLNAWGPEALNALRRRGRCPNQ